MGWLANPDVWASFVTLAALEIVLGIDNLVFIALVAGRLPPRQAGARQLGLALAFGHASPCSGRSSGWST